jgi:hypothetical protein
MQAYLELVQLLVLRISAFISLICQKTLVNKTPLYHCKGPDMSFQLIRLKIGNTYVSALWSRGEDNAEATGDDEAVPFACLSSSFLLFLIFYSESRLEKKTLESSKRNYNLNR